MIIKKRFFLAILGFSCFVFGVVHWVKERDRYYIYKYDEYSTSESNYKWIFVCFSNKTSKNWLLLIAPKKRIICASIADKNRLIKPMSSSESVTVLIGKDVYIENKKYKLDNGRVFIINDMQVTQEKAIQEREDFPIDVEKLAQKFMPHQERPSPSTHPEKEK